MHHFAAVVAEALFFAAVLAELQMPVVELVVLEPVTGVGFGSLQALVAEFLSAEVVNSVG